LDFDTILKQTLELVESQKRVSYRAIKRRFDVDDDYLEDLREEILFAHSHINDEEGRGLVWTDPEDRPMKSPQSGPDEEQSALAIEPSIAVSPPAAERRQLTVMFCDLVESTRLAGQLDPEELREVIRAYQERAVGVIQQYEGHVAQYLGDGLLVYFGWPQAHEDDAQRAVHTGLGIVQDMENLNFQLEQDNGIRLAVRIGIHTGPVVIGEVGSGDRQENLALGETPNIAARLEGLAAPNTVVISDDSRRLVAGAFEYDELGTPKLKGVSESIRVFRVRGHSTVASRFEATTTTLTPMVGREIEVALLMRCWEQTLEGEGQVVLMNGPPGIGKSRLLQALGARLADTPHVRLLYQCSPYHTNSAFYPIAAQVTRAMQLPSDATSDAKLERLEVLVTQTGLPLEETVPLFAAMLSISTEGRYPPLSLPPERQKERILELFAQGLVNLSRQEAVLFYFEDMHWSDPTSLEVLDLVIDQIQDARVLMVLTYRPEFEPTWGDHRHVTTYTLNHLSRRQTVDLVEHVTGGKALPAEVLGQIVDKTDGIPLFIEELTKHVLESEWLTDAGECYQLTSPLPPLAIPETLQDSLMARLDRLASVKEAAQLGAAIGREFSYALLRAVSRLSDTTLQETLGQLLGAELISQRGSVPDSIYSFKHALIQDTAYASMLRSTRQQVHQRIAQVLETQFAETVETQPELVAHHYTEAACHQEAAVYWRRAGERASAGSAYVEAVAHFQKGLEMLQPLPETAERAELELAHQVGLGTSLIVSEGWTAPAVEQAYVRAYELCQQLGEPPVLISVLQGLRRLYALRGDRDTSQKARELGEQLLVLAQRQNDTALLQEAHWALGQTLYYLGELSATRRHLEQSSAFYTPRSLVSQASRDQAGTQIACLFFTDLTSWMLGYPDQALRTSYDGLALAHELSHPFTLAFAFEQVAMIHQFRREVQATRQQAEAMIALADEQGFAVFAPVGTILLAWTLTMEGERQEAITQIGQAIATLRAGFDKINPDWALHYARLAEAYGAVGQTEEGLRSVADALALIDNTGFRVYEPELHRLRGELLLQQTGSDPSQVESCFHQALNVARRQQAKSWELRAATSLARLWQSQGKRSEALDLLTLVYGWFTEGFDTADLKDANVLLMELS